MTNFILLVSLALFAGFAFADILITRRKLTDKLRICHIPGIDSDEHLQIMANALRHHSDAEIYFCILCQHHFLRGVTKCKCAE